MQREQRATGSQQGSWDVAAITWERDTAWRRQAGISKACHASQGRALCSIMHEGGQRRVRNRKQCTAMGNLGYVQSGAYTLQMGPPACCRMPYACAASSARAPKRQSAMASGGMPSSAARQGSGRLRATHQARSAGGSVPAGRLSAKSRRARTSMSATRRVGSRKSQQPCRGGLHVRRWLVLRQQQGAGDMAGRCPRHGLAACSACAAHSNSVSSLLQWLLHCTSLTSTHTARGMQGSAPAGRSTAGMGVGVSEGQA